MGVKAAGAQEWRPYHLHRAESHEKSGSLNLPDPQGLFKTFRGKTLPLRLPHKSIILNIKCDHYTVSNRRTPFTYSRDAIFQENEERNCTAAIAWKLPYFGVLCWSPCFKLLSYISWKVPFLILPPSVTVTRKSLLYSFFYKLQKNVILQMSSQNCEKRLLAPSSLSVRTEQLGSQWKDFHEIWFLNLFRKSVEKIHVLLKSDKNNGYFTWRRFHIYDNISLNSS